MPRIAIVLVTYNSAAEIEGCLDALAGLPDSEVVVVDNASSDGSAELARRRGARVLDNRVNTGFAGAVNQGTRATTAPLILLLNPDAHFRTGMEALIACFDDPATGAAAGMLTGADGLPQAGFTIRNLPTATALVFETLGINRLWPRNPSNWHYRCMGEDLTRGTAVEQPAGAFLMFRRDAFEKLGGFDERFHPVWFEDVDFCARLKRSGYRVRYTPEAVAEHTGGHSVGALPVEVRRRYWYGSLLEYASKYYPPVTFRVVCFAVLFSAGLRAVWSWASGLEGSSGSRSRGAEEERKNSSLSSGANRLYAVHGSVARLALGRMFGSGKGGRERAA